jgi:aqualysin 1
MITTNGFDAVLARQRSRRQVNRRLAAMFIVLLIVALMFVGCDGNGSLAPSDSGSPAAPPAPGASLAPPSHAALIADQYIVTFNDRVTDVPALATQLIAQSRGQHLFTYTRALHGFAARMSAQAALALQHNPNVASVEQDQTAQTASVATSETNAPTGLDRIDQHALPLNGSYNYTSTGSGVSAYIMDTGIRTTHVDFGGRAAGAYTAVNDGYGTSDCGGHGTHVAGIVGATTYGVAKGVRLYAVRVFDCNASGSYSAIASAVDWITQNASRPAIVNMSFNGPPSSTLSTAIQNSISSGITYVAAAGNNSGADACNYAPGNIPGVITVAASSLTDVQMPFSNGGKCVAIFAPGAVILSTYNTSDTATMQWSGTSMAAAHVTGAGALYLENHPSASPAQVKQAIVGGATGQVLTALTSGSPNLLLYTPALQSADTTTAIAPAPPPPTAPPTAPPPVTSPAPPAASLVVSCAKLKCSADASQSTSGSPLQSYAFDFGDGTVVTGTAAKVQHSYGNSGSYLVNVTIVDALDMSANASAAASPTGSATASSRKH